MSERYELHHGDCLDILRTLPDNSIDAVVTDPPYGLAFMGKKWDYDVPSEDIWRGCLRVLKPGGHLLAFAGTRTQHRMAVRIEDAGFEIRDMIAWVYGSGFPKSLDVSKAIDKAAGAEREVIGVKENSFGRKPGGGDGWDEAIEGGKASDHVFNITAPATDAAKQWHGWGTALKPALEPITVARKPLVGTVAENVLTHGTGAINVDGCRVSVDPADPVNSAIYHAKPSVAYGKFASKENGEARSMAPPPAGRWPANLIHDGSEEVVGLFPETKNGGRVPENMRGSQISNDVYQRGWKRSDNAEYTGDSGSAARFFYCAKASKRDRDEGCEGMEEQIKEITGKGIVNKSGNDPLTARFRTIARNHHPTVKPTDLMRYLCRLVTPPGGVVLDPFTGSGSTGKGAILEGFRFIGIEREAEYIDIARARIQHAVDSLPNTLFDNTGE